LYTEQLSQALAIPATELDPVSQGVATVTSGGIDMSKWRRCMFVLMVGAVGGAGTVDAKLQESATSGGTYTDISGGGITQVTTSNKIVTLEMRAGMMTKQWCRLSVTVGGNAVLIAAVGHAGEAIHKPGGTAVGGQDIAAVAQRLVI
jgi:hypothetical protein